MFFFFSSRRRHTRWPRDWSSDVCSSDLQEKTENRNRSTDRAEQTSRRLPRKRRHPPVLARIIHERLRPSRGSFPPDTSSDLLCDAPGIAVVGLPRPDEKSLAGTRCTSASHHLGARDRSFLNKMRVFRPGVRELSGLGATFYVGLGQRRT